MTRYVIFALVSFAFNIFVMLTSPVWAAWAATGNLSRLPTPFHWVHTHDDDIYGWVDKPPTILGRWTTAMWWLCRNPGYGLDAYVLGFRKSDVVEQSISDTALSEGVRHDFLLADGSRRFGWKRDLFYKKDGLRYCKLWFGWQEHDLGGTGWHMLKFDINPFKKREA